MKKPDLTQLSVPEAVEAIRAGRLSSEALVLASLARIAETDPAVQAWAVLDSDLALGQARDMDRIRRSGRATGALHGIPVAVTDIVNMTDLPPTGRVPDSDCEPPKAEAAVVERLREAGAVILGKTRTAGRASAHPSTCRVYIANPLDTTRIVGGSSGGAAAAVATGQVPIAVGTQTSGSVTLSAAFCGIFGFKPTRGVISRRGMRQRSPTLDQVGVFARRIEDAALLSDVIGCYDPADPYSFPRPRPATLVGACSEPPVEPAFAWFEMPFHDRLSSDARDGLELILDALGDRVERLEPAPQMTGLIDVHATIHAYEARRGIDASPGEARGTSRTKPWPDSDPGRVVTRAQYEDARSVLASAEDYFRLFFNDFDAILAPGAAGEAPLISGGGAGDPVFCVLWALVGLPTLSSPLLAGEHGLPVGVQLVGGFEEDDRLLRTAKWLQTMLTRLAAEQED